MEKNLPQPTVNTQTNFLTLLGNRVTNLPQLRDYTRGGVDALPDYVPPRLFVIGAEPYRQVISQLCCNLNI